RTDRRDGLPGTGVGRRPRALLPLPAGQAAGAGRRGGRQLQLRAAHGQGVSRPAAAGGVTAGAQGAPVGSPVRRPPDSRPGHALRNVSIAPRSCRVTNTSRPSLPPKATFVGRVPLSRTSRSKAPSGETIATVP